MIDAPEIDMPTLVNEWLHLHRTQRVLGRVFADPMQANAGIYDRSTAEPIEVPWELAKRC